MINFSPKHALVAVVAVLFAGYVLFQARYLVLGPQVWINSPENGEVVSEEAVTVSGGARNIAWIELNGRQIFTNENGAWEEKLLVSDGLSIMTLLVRDRFGRESEEDVLIYKK